MRCALSLVPRARPEPTIALINIVFLMLVFFLIAGSLAPRPDPDITLISLSDIATEPPRDALLLLPDGGLRLNGLDVALADAVAHFAGEQHVRLLPDRAAPAARLIETAQALRAGGAQKLVIVTQEGVK
ncbi:ExbD/TolR family protein [Roseinatronobacter alkalisoli]|uniref:Biopolymer transporter ExbD n=1 Tax=Roseinatronobacter alkalisoli TaxID=3028235 RepID=A0ABT5T601_9RHOB|nr:biopolymer transporter ExbD [Roseinatronobacter sp. HJB301]MDD7969841.1 biopolymer transporter ExbD [Roseinatronobacter sp. HJB301]